MIELDRSLAPVCRVINSCYQILYPQMPQFPKFSFTRAMITLWKAKVYPKLSRFLKKRFDEMLRELRDARISDLLEQYPVCLFNVGRQKGVAKTVPMATGAGTEPLESPGDVFAESGKEQVLARLALAVADLSVNDLTIHFLGSTKLKAEKPYASFNKLILKSTKYISMPRAVA